MASRVARVAGRTLLATLGLASLSYLIDFGVLRWKFATSRPAFDKVIVRRMFAVPHKDGKEEYLENDPHAESCVNSLYPHSAVPPCWYLKRHQDQKVNL